MIKELDEVILLELAEVVKLRALNHASEDDEEAWAFTRFPLSLRRRLQDALASVGLFPFYLFYLSCMLQFYWQWWVTVSRIFRSINLLSGLNGRRRSLSSLLGNYLEKQSNSNNISLYLAGACQRRTITYCIRLRPSSWLSAGSLSGTWRPCLGRRGADEQRSIWET